MVVSAMGMHARSAMMRVMTSSKGCISPICLFPMRRIMIMSVIKINSVRMTISPMRSVCEIFRPLMCGFAIGGKKKRASAHVL